MVEQYRIFIFCHTNNWGTFRRRHEALAREFAGRPDIKEVVHVEPALSPVRLARQVIKTFSHKDPGLRRAAWLLIRKSLSPVPVRVADKLSVFNPVVLFPYSIERFLPPARVLNRWLLDLQMRPLLKILRSGPALTLFSPPQVHTEHIVSQLQKNEIDFYCDLVDDIYNRNRVRGENASQLETIWHRYTVALSKCQGAFALTEDMIRDYGNLCAGEVHMVPNGTPAEAGHVSPAPSPVNKKRKTVVYVGAINNALDDDIVESLLLRMRDVEFVFVGPCVGKMKQKWKKQEREYSNLRIVSPVSHEYMKEYLAAADVLVHFKDPKRCKGCDSLKLYEYLATGKPIVTTPMSPAHVFADVVYTAADAPSFVAQLEKALCESDPALPQARRRAVQEHSWEHRADAMLQIMTGEKKSTDFEKVSAPSMKTTQIIRN